MFSLIASLISATGCKLLVLSQSDCTQAFRCKLQKIGNRETFAGHLNGFHKGNSTGEARDNTLYLYFSSYETRSLCFVDCQEAFDTVNHLKLTKVMNRAGIPKLGQ